MSYAPQFVTTNTVYVVVDLSNLRSRTMKIRGNILVFIPFANNGIQINLVLSGIFDLLVEIFGGRRRT